MASKRDYYQILGLTRDATADAVKKAYRQAAMNYHPDRNPDDREAEEKFKLASEAYEVLSDPQKRVIYDQFGHAGLSGTDFHPFTNVEDIFQSFGDIFEDFFGLGGFGRRGGAGRRSRVRRGEDMAYNLTIEFLESYQSCEKEVEIRKEVICEHCEGKGYPPSSHPTTCPQCHGRGQVHHSQGFFTISTTCSVCRGEGVVVKVLCGTCKGEGVVLREKKLKIKVPAGVSTGNRLILKGEGGPGREGAPSGDLYVVLHVNSHPLFQRDGLDVWMDLPISFVQAALGDTLQVPTLEGEEEITIPKGIDAGETIVLKGKGFPEVRGGEKGNQMIQVVIKTPKDLTPEQEALLQQFAKAGKMEEVSTEKKEEGKKAKKKKRKFPW
jgi:molecular chaperone DnaJ